MATRRLAKPRPVQGKQVPLSGGPPRDRVAAQRDGHQNRIRLTGLLPKTLALAGVFHFSIIRFVSVTLLDRDQPLAALRSAFERSRDEGHLLLLGGEAGVGKSWSSGRTRLLSPPERNARMNAGAMGGRPRRYLGGRRTRHISAASH